MQPQSSTFLFYDGPRPPPGIFDDLLAIPFIAKNVSTRSFLSLVQSFGDNAASNIRYTSQPFSIVVLRINYFRSLIGTTTSVLSLTPSFLAAVVNETTVRFQELRYLLTNISVTVLGNQAYPQKRRRHWNFGRAFLPLTLLA